MLVYIVTFACLIIYVYINTYKYLADIMIEIDVKEM
jgi:hypothetical protein